MPLIFPAYYPLYMKAKSDRDTAVDGLIGLLSMTEDQSRMRKLIKLYADYHELIAEAPASAKSYYHNAYAGGYVDHVNNVVKMACNLYDMFTDFGGTPDCTTAELVFACVHHDLGKVGTLEDGPRYKVIEHDKKQHERGIYFEYAEGSQHMSVFDRTMYILSQYEISLTKNEILGIRMADGVFDAANDTYYKANGPFPHRSNIGYIVHWADWMSTMCEKDKVRVPYEKLNHLRDND